MTPDFTKKSGMTPLTLEKLINVLTMLGVEQEKIDKVKEVLSEGVATAEPAHPDMEGKAEDATDMGTEKSEEAMPTTDPKKKLTLPGIKVVCISE